jgi:hypothetical protein
MTQEALNCINANHEEWEGPSSPILFVVGLAWLVEREAKQTRGQEIRRLFREPYSPNMP